MRRLCNNRNRGASDSLCFSPHSPRTERVWQEAYQNNYSLCLGKLLVCQKLHHKSLGICKLLYLPYINHSIIF